MILKDLARLDQLDSINKINELTLFELYGINKQKDSLIFSYKDIVFMQGEQLSLKDQTLEVNKSVVNVWKKKYKKEKCKKFIVGGVGLGVLILFALASG